MLWPEFAQIGFINGKPIGFALSLPDINQVLKNIPSGRLLPFGIFTLLNGLRPNTPRVAADTREALSGLDCDVCPIVIHDRADYRNASVAARTAQETDPGSKAAEEMAALWAWLASILDNPTTLRKDNAA